MALSFDKAQLGNLEYSLQREMLATNRAGGYMSTTIVCCNTRKYHGLMVCPVRELQDQEFVLLSSLDETIVQHNQKFNLALHKFNGVYEPRGHKYITDFYYTPTQTIIYKVGGVTLKKELLWIHSAEQLLVRYTLLTAKSKTSLRLRPFLAFRNRHELSKTNMDANTKCYETTNGIKVKLYEKLPSLYMQLSDNSKHITAPDWYYNFEYQKEEERGFQNKEDLFTTGYFEIELIAGQCVVFSASTTNTNHTQLKKLFETELKKRSDKKDFESALKYSARQFLIDYMGKSTLQRGYPWYTPSARETLIALGGCTLSQGLVEECKEILTHLVSTLQAGIFEGEFAADTQLWLLHTLSQYQNVVGEKKVWSEFSEAIKKILWTYRTGDTPYGAVRMTDNGLIYARLENHPLTWMNAKIEGMPVTQRAGFCVEINALWYNAICCALELAQKAKDLEFIKEWEELSHKVANSIVETFWDEEKQYLADYVDSGYKNFDIRPNQLLAISLKYTALSELQQGAVLKSVRSNLLCNRGVRTLGPQSISYQGRYCGNEEQRARALHQGTAWPWLLEFYVKAAFKLDGKNALIETQEILEGFNEELGLYGIGSVAEVYDANPPHQPSGAISSAPSVGAIIRIIEMVDGFKGTFKNSK